MSSSADARPTGVRPAPVPDLRLVRVPSSTADLPLPRESTDAHQRARVRAEADGYAAGYFRGIAESRARAATELAVMRAEAAHAAQEAEQRRQEQVASAVAALRAAAEGLDAQVDRIRSEVVADSADLAALLVEAILGHELGRLDAETAATDLVRRVVAALDDLAAETSGHGDTVSATVRVSPELLALVPDEDREDLLVRGARIVGDPSVARHDALVDAATTRVDLRLGAAVDRVQAALRGESR